MKKRITAWLLSLALVLCAAGASAAESTAPDFETLSFLEWSFSSGAGAWSTDLRIREDGSFSGEYHDSEMGETGEAYPDGTVYGCSFTGRFVLAGQANEYAWRVRVEKLTADDPQAGEEIADGIRYVTAAPYGLSEGDEMLLYRPGTPLSALSEDALFWTHALEEETRPDVLKTWFLFSEKNVSGFVGDQSWTGMSLANPWEDLTAEQLLAASGLFFSVPEEAKNVIYRYMRSENLAEMQFSWEEDEFCARVEPIALEEGELAEISGMYFDWEYEEPVTVCGCPGLISQAQCGSEDWVERVLWYDAEKGLMHSLSVKTIDLDGLDLTAVAEQIFPAQEAK